MRLKFDLLNHLAERVYRCLCSRNTYALDQFWLKVGAQHRGDEAWVVARSRNRDQAGWCLPRPATSVGGYHASASTVHIVLQHLMATVLAGNPHTSVPVTRKTRTCWDHPLDAGGSVQL